jgi:acyl dehydratase
MSLKASDLKIGDTRTEVIVEDLKRTQIVMYAGSSGDYNPLHTDEKFTTEIAGYPSVFAHGMLTMGMTGRVLTDWVGDGRLTKYGVRFTKQVFPGDTLTTTATVEDIRSEAGTSYADFKVSTRNQDGDEVVSGYASARLD